MRYLIRVIFSYVLTVAVSISFAASQVQSAKRPVPASLERGDFGNMQFHIVRLAEPCEAYCPQWIQAKGKISWGSFHELNKLLAHVENRKLPIIIDSRGGDVMAAMAIGRLIRKYAMTTAVGDTKLAAASNGTYAGDAIENHARCFSACPLLLLGGTKRIVGPLPVLGLHQPLTVSRAYINRYWQTWRYVKGRKVITSKVLIGRTPMRSKEVAGMTPALRKKLLSYIKEMDGSPEILGEMAKASPNELNVIAFTTGDAARLGFATEEGSFLNVTSKATCSIPSPAPNCVPAK